jgi:hypothetical protein
LDITAPEREMSGARRYGTAAVAMAGVAVLGFYFYPTRSEPPAAPPRMHKVTLTWDKAARAVSYNVYRRAYRSDQFSKLGSSATPSYEDPAAPSREIFCYQVTAVDAKGQESRPSREACVSVPPN